MKSYDIKYKMHSSGEIRNINVNARNKEEAYDKAYYEAIPNREYELPYSAWVYGVTYFNGKYQKFNTSEGNPY